MQSRANQQTLFVCYTGQDCAKGAPWSYTSTLQQATLDAVSNNCGFLPHSAPTPDTDPTDGYSESPICPGNRPCIIGRTTQQDILPNCHYPESCPGGSIKPAPSRLFGSFQLPANTWAKLCHQWDFLEPSSGQFYVPLYAKAWRHMNETWAFVPDITQCPCYPSCAVCGTFAYNTGIYTVDDACLEKYGLEASSCGYKVVGVTGGAVIYPESTTKLPMNPGNPPTPQTCWMYANILGTKTRTMAQMLQDHPEWQ